MNPYDHLGVEAYWQKKWVEDCTYRTDTHSSKKPFYGLVEFPYPSGAGLHVGHVRSYTGMDVIVRKRRMEGFETMFPIGWDAFGLPAENYAIKTGIHPSIETQKNINTFRQQLKACGFSFDWEREVDTTDPSYYKWTQWIFLKLYEKGLAYKKEMPVNWCPKDKCVLANEEVVDGKCERCGTQAEKRNKEQWMLAITKYAERLDKDLDETDFLERIKIQQRNWIGMSDGSEIDFKIKANDFTSSFTVYTTRADTLFGCTYCVLAPEHSLVKQMLAEGKIQNKEEVTQYVHEAIQKIDIDRSAEGKEKTGVRLEGVTAINPANNEEVPVFIADYVLATYGTGAIMAVPAHDERDGEFAKKYNIETKAVIARLFELTGDNAERPNTETITRTTVDPILRDVEGNFYCIKEPNGHVHFAGGGVDGGETEVEALAREITEETGFTDFEITKKISPDIFIWGFRHTKQKNQRTSGPSYEVVLKSTARIPSEVEAGNHELVSFKKDDVLKNLSWEHHKFLFEEYLNGVSMFTGDGVLVNSGEFAGLRSAEARIKITEAVGGRIVKKSKLRDWVFARQRYWGEPIPLVYDSEGKMYPVHDNQLPITLPQVDRFEPTDNGESPLYQVPEWVNVEGFINKDGKFISTPGFSKIAYNKDEPLDVNDGDGGDAYKSGADIVERNNVVCIVKHPTEEKYLIAKWKQVAWCGFVTGGIESGATMEDTAKAEVAEETGYQNIKSVTAMNFASHGLFYHVVKKQNRFAHYNLVVVELADLEKKEVSAEEAAIADFVWVDKGEVEETLTRFDMKSVWQYYTTGVFDTTKSTRVGMYRRETDTMPQWAGSSWYFMRYIDPRNDQALGEKETLMKWLPVTWYNGGMEHTTLHLLYSRFWYKFLFDIGLTPTSEPYMKRTSQGMILGTGGVKMSKSLGNVVNPDEIVKKFGADTLRMYEMFIGPFDQAVAWDDKAVIGIRRFVDRIYSLRPKVSPTESALSVVHKTIKKVGEDIESMAFNTAISSLMICLNVLEKEEAVSQKDFESFLLCLAPFAPFITEELWKDLGHSSSIHLEPWPGYDENKIIDDVVTYALQVNGKLRGTVSLARTMSEDEVLVAIKQLDGYKQHVGENPIKKQVFVPGKLVNIVI